MARGFGSRDGDGNEEHAVRRSSRRPCPRSFPEFVTLDRVPLRRDAAARQRDSRRRRATTNERERARISALRAAGMLLSRRGDMGAQSFVDTGEADSDAWGSDSDQDIDTGSGDGGLRSWADSLRAFVRKNKSGWSIVASLVGVCLSVIR